MLFAFLPCCHRAALRAYNTPRSRATAHTTSCHPDGAGEAPTCTLPPSGAQNPGREPGERAEMPAEAQPRHPPKTPGRLPWGSPQSSAQGLSSRLGGAGKCPNRDKSSCPVPAAKLGWGLSPGGQRGGGGGTNCSVGRKTPHAPRHRHLPARSRCQTFGGAWQRGCPANVRQLLPRAAGVPPTPSGSPSTVGAACPVP